MSDKNKSGDDNKTDDKFKKVVKKKNDKLSNGEAKETQFSLRQFLNSNKLPNNRNNNPASSDYPSLLPDFVQDHIIVESTVASADKFYNSPYATSCRQNASESPYHATDEAKINHSLPDFLPHYVPKRQTNEDLNGSCAAYSNTSNTHSHNTQDYRVMYEQELMRNNFLQRKNDNDQRQIEVLTEELKECEKSLQIKNMQLSSAKFEISELREEVQKLHQRFLQNSENSSVSQSSQQLSSDIPLLEMVTRADDLVHSLSDVIRQMHTSIQLNNDN